MPEDYKKDMYWLCLMARDETAKMLGTETGKSLCPFVHRGLFVTRGRLGTRAMTKALGYSELIIQPVQPGRTGQEQWDSGLSKERT